MLTIRQAIASDLPGIQGLMDSLNFYREKNFSQKNTDFHKRTKTYSPIQISDISESIFFVAIEEEEIIGFIQGSIHARPNHLLKNLWYIDELFVHENHRWSGTAWVLLSTLEWEFRSQWCDHLTTHTDAENSLSQGFYERSGMSPVTVELWKKL